MGDVFSTSSRDCSDCGAPLAAGVCPACAFGSLVAPVSVPTVEKKLGDLDIEFGRYLFKRKLASGGMGVVYEAEDRELKRQVAVKMIRGSIFANESERARFKVESEAAAGLDHPNIIPIYEVGTIDDQPFFTMKFVEGRSFGDCLREGCGLRQMVAWLSQIAHAVQHAHQRGVLHRDLKPGNILIDGDGRAWLMDFGLAKLAHEDHGLTRTSDHLGTPHYMPPEVARGAAGDFSTASDVWSLGVILWELVCGERPFDGGGTVEIMRRISDAEPLRPDRGGDRDLLTLAERCMEKNPAKRVGSAGEFASELERWLNGEPLLARRITVPERIGKWIRRKPLLAALYLVLAVGVISSFSLWQRAETAVSSLMDTNDQLGSALAISTARRMAMEARVQVDEHPARALLLAVESIERTEASDIGVLPEAADALFETLQKVGGRDGSPRERLDDGVNFAFIAPGLTPEFPSVVSPDGQRLLNVDYVTEGDSGIAAAVVELQTHGVEERSLCWEIFDRLELAHQYRWLPDSDSVITFDSSGAVRIWEGFDFAGEEPSGRVVGDIAIDGMKIWQIHVAAIQPDAESMAIHVVHQDESSGVVWISAWDVLLETEVSLVQRRHRRLPAEGITNPKYACRFSPDGRRLLFVADGKMYLANLDDAGSDIQLTPVPGEGELAVRSAFSPCGEWLLCGDRDLEGEPIYQLYDLRDQDLNKVGTTRRTLCQPDGFHSLPVFSEDGGLLAVSLSESVIELHQTEPESPDGRPVASYRNSESAVFAIGMSDDGRWLAAGSADGLVSVWATDQPYGATSVLEFRGLRVPVLAVDFSPDGQSLFAAGMNSRFRHWRFDGYGTGAIPELVPVEPHPVTAHAVSPGKRWMALACVQNRLQSQGADRAGPVKVVDTSSGNEWVIAGHEIEATGVAFSPDGRWLASTGRDGLALVWDWQALSAHLEAGHAGPLPSPIHQLDMRDTRLQYHRKLAFHPRGTLYCTCGDGVVFEWDLNLPDPQGGRRAHVVHSIRYLLPNLCVSEDGRWMAVARHGWDLEPVEGSNQFGNQVLLFDVSEAGPPRLVTELQAHFVESTELAFSRDGRWLAAGTSCHGAQVWDLDTPDRSQSTLTAEFSSQFFGAVGFSPSGRQLAVGGADGKILLWNPDRKLIERSITSKGAIACLEWLDEDLLLTTGRNGKVAIWQTNTAALKELARDVAGRSLGARERAAYQAQRAR